MGPLRLAGEGSVAFWVISILPYRAIRPLRRE